jgi:trk system potassium uptake protein TrkH
MHTEQLNNLLYGSKELAYRILRIVSYINSFLGLGLLIYGFGFDLSIEEAMTVYTLMNTVFIIFVIDYLLRILYSFNRVNFLKRTWFEATILFFIILNGLANFLHGDVVLRHLFESLGVVKSYEFYDTFRTLYLGLILGLELTKASTQLAAVQIKPATTFIGSFVLLIILGTGLLMLPAMTTSPGNMSFINALFTSASATCVTGLIVVDTATYFTFKGQLVILGLIQIGGIGIVSFATFFATFFNKGVGLKHQSIIQSHLSSETLYEAKDLLRKIILITLGIEIAGFLGIYMTWGDEVVFESLGKKIFISLFHSVSAFCNAGFSLYSDGLYQSSVKGAYLLHIVVAGIIIMGGLGFTVITDLFSPTALRERLEKPWKGWQLGTRMALFSTLALIIIGSVIIYTLEYNNTLKGLKVVEAGITAFFQSVSTRTAGFNTVDFSALTRSTLIFMMLLMFIGTNPGSTGGGIKTTTFVLIAASAIATIRSKKSVDIGHRHIPSEIISKAFSVFAFAVGYNLVAIFILSITEPQVEILKLAFEQVSAFATVGLSTGITATLSIYGKIIIILSMFFGRVGMLTLALALSRRVSSTAYKYPTGYVLVG